MTESVAATAPPNRLTADELRVRPGADGVSMSIDQRRAGWRYLDFEVHRLAKGASIGFHGAGAEMAVVVLAGGALTVEGVGTLPGRPSPFDALPSAAYVPSGSPVTLTAVDSVEIAMAVSPVFGGDGLARSPILITPADVDVEVRGAGNATRQINHIVKPDFPAEKLLVVEVLTPSGNWSSWPPHKHDVDDMPAEAVLEEVYCYRFRRPEAWGIQRVYRRPGTPAFEAAGPRDAILEVRHGDVVIVPDGYHPFVAAHGSDAYYLNALAGDRRTMACSFDPDLDRVRVEWQGMTPDPRVPIVRR